MEGKRPAKQRIFTRSASGRYVGWRSIMVHWRSIRRDNTARTKTLEISALRAVRSVL